MLNSLEASAASLILEANPPVNESSTAIAPPFSPTSFNPLEASPELSATSLVDLFKC